MNQIKNAPGLKWIRRKASYTPVWVARDPDYTPRTRNLRMYSDDPGQIAAMCRLYEAEMEAWRAGIRSESGVYDGTLGWLLMNYYRDPDSPYQSLKPSSRVPYDHYLGKMEYEIGGRKLSGVTGVDVKKWHDAWSENGKRLAASAMCRAVLDAAISFGIMCRKDGCAELAAVLREANRRLPQPRRREIVITAGEVEAARAAAHKDGRPGWALAYALAYETTLRLWDVIGQWVPLDTPGVSDVVDPARGKWFGLRWEHIDEHLVLRFVPSKTQGKTGKSVTYPLSMAPMVMEELTMLPPAETRSGPVVINGRTGLPPTANNFRKGWYHDRAVAGITKKAWARDLRASGITEARGADVKLDDAAMVAGHSSTRTTGAVYDRANLQAAERFAAARVAGRQKKPA